MKTVLNLTSRDIASLVKLALIQKGHDVETVRLTATYQKGDRPGEGDATFITAEVEIAPSKMRDSDTLPEPMDEKTRAWALARAKACPDRSGD